MNKRLVPMAIGCVLSASLLLAACSGPSEQVSDVSQADAASAQVESATSGPVGEGGGESEEAKDIEVDEGLFTTEVRLPMSLFTMGEDESAAPPTQEELQAIVDEEGSDVQVTVNDDGTVSYFMSRSEYNRLKVDFKKSVDETIQEAINKESNIYKSVTYVDDMTEFDIVVDRKAYESSFSFIGLTILFSAGFYQAFTGLEEAERLVILNYIDEESGEVFDTFDSRTLQDED